MLTVQNVNLYYGAAQALRGVSLSATIGRVTCLLGRNGVGKTSLLRAISGMQSIGSGTIQVDGQEISKLPPYERARRGVALVPQGREIFPLLTVKENLETGFAPVRREHKKIPDEVFELFPVLQSMLKRRGGDLSGGQQQQLAIGRALTMRPKLLLLDEPTEGIQPSVIKDIGRAITFLRQRGDMAIVLVEQYLDFAHELADDFAVMDRGEVVLSGTRETFDVEAVRKHMTVYSASSPLRAPQRGSALVLRGRWGHDPSVGDYADTSLSEWGGPFLSPPFARRAPVGRDVRRSVRRSASSRRRH